MLYDSNVSVLEDCVYVGAAGCIVIVISSCIFLVSRSVGLLRKRAYSKRRIMMVYLMEELL